MDCGNDLDLKAACEAAGRHLDGLFTHDGQPVDGVALLWAISFCESNRGQLSEYVRAEPGYSPGGYYYRSAEHVRNLYKRWGCLAASSFGAFQIMYVTAYELGFRQHPICLQNNRVCAQWAAKLIRDRFYKAQGARTLDQVLDCYNTGNFKDRNRPTAYIAKGIRAYNEAVIDLEG